MITSDNTILSASIHDKGQSISSAASATPNPGEDRSFLIIFLATSLVFLAPLSIFYIITHIRTRRKWLALAERNARLSSTDVLRLRADNTWELLPKVEERGNAGLYAATELWAEDPWDENRSQQGDVLFSADLPEEEEDAPELPMTFDKLVSSTTLFPSNKSSSTLVYDPLTSQRQYREDAQAGWPAVGPCESPLRLVNFIDDTVSPSGSLARIEAVDKAPDFRILFQPPMPRAGWDSDADKPSRQVCSSTAHPTASPLDLSPLCLPDDNNDHNDLNEPTDTFYDAFSTPLVTPDVPPLPLHNVPGSPFEMAELSLTDLHLLQFGHADIAPTIPAEMLNPSSFPDLISFPDPDDLPLAQWPVSPTRISPKQARVLSPLPNTPHVPAVSPLNNARIRRVRSAHLTHRPPAWSVRALDASTIGLPASPATSPSSLSASSTKNIRASSEDSIITASSEPDPEPRHPPQPVDVVLAMQLRPDLGLGVDAAWMVQFLITMFGWFAVLLSGQGARIDKKKFIGT